mmetsp:Transcript_1782/g.5180  ORF Transcript_1782/g.5180 Transcript_1782/m.5180 type:complete len:206 (+) Transcript_1782:2151-2768(+)
MPVYAHSTRQLRCSRRRQGKQATLPAAVDAQLRSRWEEPPPAWSHEPSRHGLTSTPVSRTFSASCVPLRSRAPPAPGRVLESEEVRALPLMWGLKPTEERRTATVPPSLSPLLAGHTISLKGSSPGCLSCDTLGSPRRRILFPSCSLNCLFPLNPRRGDTPLCLPARRAFQRRMLGSAAQTNCTPRYPSCFCLCCFAKRLLRHHN